jgi:type II secretory pathway component PulJ
MSNVSPARIGNSKRKSQGFSLLEVLVATFLMGLMLILLQQVLASALRSMEASRRVTRAVLVAEDVLQEYCERKNLNAGSYQNRQGDYSYRVLITPQYEVSDSSIRVLSPKVLKCSLIQVTVSWREWGRAKSLNLATVRTVTEKKL